MPLLAAGGSMVISAMLLFKGLKNLELGLDMFQNLLVMGMTAAVVWFSIFIFARSMKKKSLSKATFTLFSWMQVFTASAFAFSHGSNDIANAVVVVAPSCLNRSRRNLSVPKLVESGGAEGAARVETIVRMSGVSWSGSGYRVSGGFDVDCSPRESRSGSTGLEEWKLVEPTCSLRELVVSKPW